MVDTSRDAGLPVPGRLVAAGDVADAVDRHAATGPRSRRCCASPSAAWTATTSTPWRRSSAWPSAASGGETGVVAVQALRGDAVWKAMAAGSWTAGGWDPRLFEACLCRSQTLAQPPTFSHRYPTAEQMREWVKDPVAYRFEYADGLKATMLLMNGLVGDFTFAARLKGQAEPLSTLFYLPPNPNVVYSAALMSKAEEMFLTGKAAVPDRADAADERAWSRPACSRWPTARSGSRRRTWRSATRRRASRPSGNPEGRPATPSPSTSRPTETSKRTHRPGSARIQNSKNRVGSQWRPACRPVDFARIGEGKRRVS